MFNTFTKRLFAKNNIHLTYQITKRLFLAQDQNTALGLLWHILHPLLLSLALLMIFSHKFHVSIENFGFYILLGVIHFNCFSSFTTAAGASLLNNRAIILSTQIPKEVIVVSAGINTFITFLIEMVVSLILMGIMGVPIHWTIILYPLVMISLLLINLGVSFVLAAVNVFFRDITYVWGIFLRILFFGVPIFYTLEDYGSHVVNDLLRINPLSQILIMSRECILYGTVPNLLNLALMVGTAFIILLLGWIVFKMLEPSIPDKI